MYDSARTEEHRASRLDSTVLYLYKCPRFAAWPMRAAAIHAAMPRSRVLLYCITCRARRAHTRTSVRSGRQCLYLLSRNSKVLHFSLGFLVYKYCSATGPRSIASCLDSTVLYLYRVSAFWRLYLPPGRCVLAAAAILHS